MLLQEDLRPFLFDKSFVDVPQNKVKVIIIVILTNEGDGFCHPAAFGVLRRAQGFCLANSLFLEWLGRLATWLGGLALLSQFWIGQWLVIGCFWWWDTVYCVLGLLTVEKVVNFNLCCGIFFKLLNLLGLFSCWSLAFLWLLLLRICFNMVV